MSLRWNWARCEGVFLPLTLREGQVPGAINERGATLADEPHNETTSGGTPSHLLPSWQRPTKPESRWPAFGAVVIIIAGQSWVAASLSFRPVWLYPAIAGILLLASVAVYIPSRTEPSRALRMLSLGLVAVLVIANMISLVLLVRGVFIGSKLSPTGLLLAGGALWVVNVAVFALIHWELDGGGPEARADGYRDYPDLVFPQQQQDQQGLAPSDWKPTFPDYLFVSLTAATAFSPTDAMPYSKWAKLVMGVESILAFVIAAMLVARAINIARG
jgi:hypothetical protein